MCGVSHLCVVQLTSSEVEDLDEDLERICPSEVKSFVATKLPPLFELILFVLLVYFLCTPLPLSFFSPWLLPSPPLLFLQVLLSEGVVAAVKDSSSGARVHTQPVLENLARSTLLKECHLTAIPQSWFSEDGKADSNESQL